MCSSIFSTKGKKADVARVKECVEIIKKNTGVLSDFRGYVKMALASMMAMEEDAEGFLRQIMEVYDMLKVKHKFAAEYIVIAAASICNMDGYDRKEEIVAKTEEIYKKMKEDHPILTSYEDCAYAAMLAAADVDMENVKEEMESCYKLLEKDFFSKNAVQSLSQILALSTEDSAKKCDKVKAIYNGLKGQKKQFGVGMELSVLGGVALVEESAESLTALIAETDNLLETKKGFSGFFGAPKNQRLMCAALLVLSCYMEKIEGIENAAVTSVVAMLIAQQMALTATVFMATVAASSTQ
ncbi:MAG: DUF4003 family protein [Lachnospiraceae bacterium]|nr:DUF4003 family protein [Lachnospiraceae bacterium]